MTRLVIPVAAIAMSACAFLGPLTPSQSASMQQTAARIADGLTVAEVALDQTGTLLDALPLSTAQKDAFDCGIMKVNGHDAPPVAVLKICGAIPSSAEAPIGKALQALRHATDRTLCGIVKTVLDAIQPLLGRLEAAGVPVSTAKVALGFTVQFAGGCR